MGGGRMYDDIHDDVSLSVVLRARLRWLFSRDLGNVVRHLVHEHGMSEVRERLITNLEADLTGPEDEEIEVDADMSENIEGGGAVLASRGESGSSRLDAE